jgi:hypothetical protein
MAWVATAAMPIVSAIRRGLGHQSTPMLPPPPGRFSMMTVPRLSLTRSARSRAVTSIGPPGA